MFKGDYLILTPKRSGLFLVVRLVNSLDVYELGLYGLLP